MECLALVIVYQVLYKYIKIYLYIKYIKSVYIKSVYIYIYIYNFAIYKERYIYKMNTPTYISVYIGAMVFYRCAESDFQICRVEFLSFRKYA